MLERFALSLSICVLHLVLPSHQSSCINSDFAMLTVLQNCYYILATKNDD